MKKLIILTIHQREEKESFSFGLFLVPGITSQEILERLGCPKHVLVRFRKSKIFRPDEVVYECLGEGDHLEVIPIVWKDAPWLPTGALDGIEGPENLSEPLEFPEDAVVN